MSDGKRERWLNHTLWLLFSFPFLTIRKCHRIHQEFTLGTRIAFISSTFLDTGCISSFKDFKFSSLLDNFFGKVDIMSMMKNTTTWELFDLLPISFIKIALKYMPG